MWVGREHAARVRALAGANATARFVSLGANRVVDSHNIVAVVPGIGRTAEAGNENIIVTCHHDAPSSPAVEDASGLAVLLALAKEFAAARQGKQPPGRDLVFVASPGYFHGGIGNRVFVEHHAEGLLKRTVAAFGVEHVAEEVESDGHGGYQLTGRPEVRALFFDGSDRFAAVLAVEAERCGLDRMIGTEPPCDSAPSFPAGIPSIGLSDGAGTRLGAMPSSPSRRSDHPGALPPVAATPVARRSGSEPAPSQPSAPLGYVARR